MIKLFHTGDVHLDSPFSGLSPETAALRRRELRETFSAMMSYARTSGADIVLIAGDLLDRRFATGETVKLIKNELAAVGCPVVISPGNHDPADGRGIWQSGRLPDNVHVFTDDTLSHFSFDSLGVNVYGYAFTSPELTASPVAGEFVHDKSRINILLCHADMTSPVSKDAPLSKSQLEAFGADYAALGHIHNGELYKGTAGRCTYAYCGCPEGRDFGECGSKGALIVEIDENEDPVSEGRRITVTKKAFCRKRYEDVTVPVDGTTSISEIYKAARESVAGVSADERTILRLTFTGTVDPDVQIEPASVEALFTDLAGITVRDRTSPSLSFSENDPTVRGEYCRLLAPMLESADPAEREKAILALKLGMAALSGTDM